MHNSIDLAEGVVVVVVVNVDVAANVDEVAVVVPEDTSLMARQWT